MALREIPTFHPTMKEFKDFSGYIKKIEEEGAHHYGLAKIVPPKSWSHKTPVAYSSAMRQSPIPSPIEQQLVGTKGTYMMMNIEKKMRTVEDYKQYATQKDKVAPKHENYDDLERHFWRERPYGQVMYGADIPGTHFKSSVKEFNLGSLEDILHQQGDEEGFALLGVNTPYLYYGMWKATFCWHVEDMNLYSINFVHQGAPKTWYCIPPEHGERFETLVQGLIPGNFRACPQFLRHKMTFISPSIVKNAGIPIYKVTQEVGEFIITFPYAYHQGFNHGFNVAEATNFASERWIDYGIKCKRCYCQEDGVRINMDPFVKQFRPELWAKWKADRKAQDSEESGTNSEAADTEDSSCEEQSEEEEEEAEPRRGAKKKLTAAERQLFRAEKEINANAARTQAGTADMLTCSVCCGEGPMAPGTVMRPSRMESLELKTPTRKGSIDIDERVVGSKELETSEDEDTAEEQEFECESGCGFEHASLKVVEAHERTCSRLRAVRGTAKNTFKQQVQGQDEVMRCVTCGTTVHRQCYGLSLGVAGYGWRCDRCTDGPRLAPCQLCPRTGGALKPTVNGKWVHVQCALALPELELQTAAELSPAVDLSAITTARRKLSCCRCKRRKKPHRVAGRTVNAADYGACVQCSHPSCAAAFHTTCAQRDMMLHATMKRPDDPDQAVEWNFLCTKHRPSSPQVSVLPGDVAWAKCRSRCFYEGTVKAVISSTLCEVVYQDGSIGKNVGKADVKPIKSLRGKAREGACRQENAKIVKKARVAAAVALANFDMVVKQPDGSQRICAVLSEDTKVTYEVELHSGEVKTVVRSNIFTAAEADKKRENQSTRRKQKASPAASPLTFVTKEQQNKTKTLPRKRLLEEDEIQPGKRQRVRHNYATLASGRHSQAQMAMFWARDAPVIVPAK